MKRWAFLILFLASARAQPGAVPFAQPDAGSAHPLLALRSHGRHLRSCDPLDRFRQQPRNIVDGAARVNEANVDADPARHEPENNDPDQDSNSRERARLLCRMTAPF